MRDVSIVAAAPEARSRVALLAGLAAGGSLALLALQAVAAHRLELTFDEAYYTLWSRSLAFGYLDHPPMVAVMIRASTALFGDSELGVRALFLVSAGALPALVALIAWRLFRSAETAALAVMMWISMPLVMAGAPFATPDAPLVLFWTLGLAALVELWRTGKARWLIAMGVALGLMLESKFTAAFFPAGAALAFLATPSLRRWLVSPASLAGLAVAAAIFAPFVVWNAEHGWATFLKQGGRTAASGFAPPYLAELVGSQVLLMNPLVFAPFAAAAAAIAWRLPAAPGSRDEARQMLVCMIAPAGFYFLVHALHDRVEGNWLAPLLPACAILAADWAAATWREGTDGLRGLVTKSALWAGPPAFAVMALAYVQTEIGFLPLGAADPTTRIEGFRDLARDLDSFARTEGARYVLTQGYALASLMTIFGDPSIVVVQPEERIRWIFQPSPDERLFWRPGLAIAEAERDFGLVLRMRFRSVERLGALERRRAGQTIGTYELYRVADPYAPVLDPPCPSAGVGLERRCRP